MRTNLEQKVSADRLGEEIRAQVAKIAIIECQIDILLEKMKLNSTVATIQPKQ